MMNAIQKFRSAWSHRGGRDAVLEFFANAPEVDEPLTEEEETGLREARAESKRGETVSLEEAFRELE
jgi:hypothetical protein